MEIVKYSWKLPSRPCNFSLCLQGGSVFADFDIDPAGKASLVRISFDGYGCCKTAGKIAALSLNDSQILVDAVNADDVDREEVRDVLLRYFERNESVIWRDALEEHALLNERRPDNA